MKICWITLGVLLASVGAGLAQLAVEVRMDQDQFLPGERLPATVRIANRSGRTLKLGADPDWLRFDVQEKRSKVITKYGEPPVVGEFTLENSKVAIKKVDLAPYFDLMRPGRYNVTATIRVKEWDTQTTSAPKGFDVQDGTKIWFQDFGVPAAGDNTKPPLLRRYALLQANYLRSDLRLYFRLTDEPGGKLLKVFSMGEMVSFGHPEVEMDSASCLHVLCQNGARTSRYTVINPDGEILVRHLYKYDGVKPALVPAPGGKVAVSGAVQVPDEADIPVTKPPE